MIKSLIVLALEQRLMVMLAAVGLIAYGTYSIYRLNLDAFPDVTNVQVQVYTEAPGLASVEVEKLITFPVESVMNGVPGVTEVRSISKTGLSVVTVVFTDETDIYFARQLVLERLQIAKDRIPPGLGDPQMGPITTGLGQVYRYILVGDGYSLTDLRTLNDWTVKFQLRTVPGIADVLSFGGSALQYQVNTDPNALLSYGLTLADLKQAITENNSNAGGWYIEGDQQQLVVRGEGWVRPGDAGLRDIGNIVVKWRDGTPVRVRDVANVAYGEEIRQGAVTMNGRGEVVMGVVLQLKGANTKKVIDRIKEKIPSIQKTLPAGVKIVPVYDQADLIDRAVETVRSALGEAAILIVIVLFLFLWNIRSALIVVCSIPLSMLIAFIMMRWWGLSANLQSLGGLAIGIGMMVDGSLVMVENIMRHLAEPAHADEPAKHRILRAAQEVGQPVFFAVLIIVVVFLPLFTLQGVEGKLFSPMAFTVAFAMLGSLIVALTVVPVLASLLMRGTLREEDSFLVRAIKRAYRPMLEFSIRRPFIPLGVAVAALLAAIAIVPRLGTEFVPALDEGTLLIRVTMNPSIALPEAKRIATTLENRLMRYPEVTYALSPIGRPELGGDPESISNNEMLVGLKPQSEWKTAETRTEFIDILKKDLGGYPGIALSFSQPIATRVDELLSGVKAQLAIKLFGDDLSVLEQKGHEIAATVETLKGASDVQMEPISGEAQLVVRADRDALARYGLNVADVMDLVSTGIGGEAVGQVIEGQKRFDIYLRLAERFRDDPAALGNLWVANDEGVQMRLGQVAQVARVEGPPMVSREQTQRRAVIQANVDDRDLGGFVNEAQRAVAQTVTLPAGYYITWGGEFENQQRAQRTLTIVVPVALGMIFLLLYLSFGSLRNAILILLNVPFALIGGVFALWLSGQYLSVPSSVGFIALFGVAVLNGVVMVSYFNQLLQHGYSVDKAVFHGAMLRVRPVLMTAMVASLGLIPLLLATGIGSEVQRPLATVVVGGLITSTALTLLILPAIYRWFAISVDPLPTPHAAAQPVPRGGPAQ